MIKYHQKIIKNTTQEALLQYILLYTPSELLNNPEFNPTTFVKNLHLIINNTNKIGDTNV